MYMFVYVSDLSIVVPLTYTQQPVKLHARNTGRLVRCGLNAYTDYGNMGLETEESLYCVIREIHDTCIYRTES